MKLPILIMAHSRPDNLNSLLVDLEKASPREIHISIDGTDGIATSENLVYRTAVQWQKNSRHRITVEIQKVNMGLLGHFKEALRSFFARHEYGIVLEDDIEFQIQFIEFLDEKARELLKDSHWSICGHNPHSLKVQDQYKSCDTYFRETRIHTIWGWCSHRESVYDFLNFLDIGKLEANAHLAITLGAKRLTRNLILRAHIRSVWRFKLKRNLSSAKPNWDNYWILAAWFYDRVSLMSSQTLTWEGRDQNSNQTHPHSKLLASRRLLSETIRFEATNLVRPVNRKYDQMLLEVWGIKNSSAISSVFRKLLTTITR